MNISIDIRPMAVADKPQVMAILQRTPEFLPAEIVVAEEVIDDYLVDASGSGYHVYVAGIGNQVQGYVCFGHTPLTESTFDVYWIAVSPQSQGQGIGAKLMAFAEREIAASNGRLVMVETSAKPSYHKTRAFYLGLGYEAACTIPDFYAPGDGKLMLLKRLEPANHTPAW